MKSRRFVFAIAATLVVVIAGLWGWQISRARAAIAAQLPPTPNLSGWSEAMQQRVAHDQNGATAKLGDLSRVYHANGFYREAVRCYEILEGLQPNEPKWMHRHATILAGYGEADVPLVLWQKVVSLAPDYLPARLRLADLRLKTNARDAAAGDYEEVLRRKPDDPYALLGLARIDLELGHWQSARQRLESVVAQTNYQLGYDLIVTVYEHFGETEAAAAIRGRDKASGAYRDVPDPWVDELIADCYDPYRLSTVAGAAAGRGDFKKATSLLNRASDLAPEDAMPHFQLGLLDEQRRDYNDALAQFERCTILAPDLADGWAHLSAAQVRAGDSAAAERTLSEGLQRCPNSPGLHLQHARNLRKAKHLGEAIGEFRASIRLRPNEPDAYVELGSMLIEAGRTDEGIAELIASLDAQPDNPGALSILAFYAISTGKDAEARRWLTRVTQQPRIGAQQSARLLDAYRQQFGHDFVP